jgi:hypothetical protein
MDDVPEIFHQLHLGCFGNSDSLSLSADLPAIFRDWLMNPMDEYPIFLALYTSDTAGNDSS